VPSYLDLSRSAGRAFAWYGNGFHPEIVERRFHARLAVAPVGGGLPGCGAGALLDSRDRGASWAASAGLPYSTA